MKPTQSPENQRTLITEVSSAKIPGYGLAVAVSVMGLGLTAGFAEGFRDPTSSAFSLGRAGGRIAQVDDASAVAANPANLADLREIEAEFSPEVIFYGVNYRPTGGGEIGSTSPWKFLPDLFASVPVPNWPLTFGLGVTAPFGLSSEWPLNNAITQKTPFFPYYSSLTLVNANPSLAWKINDRLKVGAGLDIFWSQLDLRASVPPALFGISAPSAFLARYFGEGSGFGGNFGITWEPVDGHRFAATYRSPVQVDYTGSFNFTALPAPSTFKSDIVFPTIISVGYGWQVTKTIRLETDGEWIQFSRFGSLPLATGVQIGLPQSAPENWKDTFTLGLAGDWNFAPGWMLRAGYQYYQSPVPSSTLSPAIPDANQNAITVGLGYKGVHQGLELGYGAIFYNERDITGGNYAGKYQAMAHLISLTYRYTF